MNATLDFIGIGFGPSNLAFAVAAKEIDPRRRGVFFERCAQCDWHPGLLLDSSRMQISFLKDLVTLRNPASPYSFLQYTRAKGRLEHFINLSEFHPTRLEYRDYLRWVAQAFAEQVHYGCEVCRVSPEGSTFRVDVEDRATNTISTYRTRNVIYAAGGVPRYPAGLTRGPRVIHSSEFLHAVPQWFANPQAAFRIAVLGDGQSAGEMVACLLEHYPRAEIHLVISGYALRPVDRSPFVNEAFFLSSMDSFQRSDERARALLLRELRSTNYGVVAPELIDQIYDAAYLDSVKGVQRLFIHRFSKLASVDEGPSELKVRLETRGPAQAEGLSVDGVLLATGYERRLDAQIFADVLPLILRDESGAMRLTASHRVQMAVAVGAGLFVQGYGESAHGIADTLLSLLPFRSQRIFEEICRPVPGELPAGRLKDVEYPPSRHLENDVEKLYAVLERRPFATLVSAADDEPTVTHLPLILDRARGAMGVLFGHLDRANPQVERLVGRRVLAVFHGPEAYISPNVYTTDQLPTWNSISVHVRGTIRFIRDRDSLLRGLASICETDARPGAYRLDLSHRAIERILDYIVGFELEIEEMTGRFKLSQDRNATDQRLAALELARRSESGERALIERVIGHALEPGTVPPARPPADQCIHELFEAQALRSPQAIAVVCGDLELSYAQINTRANQLAHFLRGLGAGTETLIGLCLERSPDWLVALLGILKAGAAFVPLDPQYPQQRLDYMLRETAAPIVVTQDRLRHTLPPGPEHVLCMDADWSRITGSRASNLHSGVGSENLAYCIFTSGSTGRPKAVAMPHRGLVNHILHMKETLRYAASDRTLQFTALTADGSLQEIFTAWLAGAALVLPPQVAPSVPDFLQMLMRHRISVVSVPTAYWHFWVGEMRRLPPAEWPESVRLVIVGGEKVIPEKFKQWQSLSCTRNVTWVQDYGPTETTVSCAAFEAAPTDGPQDICIGRPNSNMQIFMLDERGMSVPDGAAGELCIAGRGLARGYLGRPDLTAERFVPNPFGPPGSRLYRSGDLARYRPDGRIEFLGRRDDQVKIMGHRIELSEVEDALLRCDGVRQAAAVAHESEPGNLRINACVVADGFEEARLREQLSLFLPRAMMPAVLISMSELPHTASGKLDRARLRALRPTFAAEALEEATALQCAIARLWAVSTERTPRSIDEDFFRAGGDSLRALSLLGRIAALTGIRIDLTAFFGASTIRQLSDVLVSELLRDCAGQAVVEDGRAAAQQELLSRISGTAERRSSPGLQRVEAQQLPASNAQQRLWFLDQLQQGTATYSVPIAYKISGAFSRERLDRCLMALVARHEALRTALVLRGDNELWQEIRPPQVVKSRHVDAADLSEALRLAHDEAILPFDLASAPLLRSLFVHLPNEQALWIINLHHCVCDAWSIAVLWRELMALYAGTDDLPAVAFQYGDYSIRQRAWLASHEADAHRHFWRERLQGDLPLLQLGRGAVSDADRTVAGALEECSFSPALSHAVREAAQLHGTTEFIVVLSAFLATLHRFSRQEEILLGVPVACRSLPETAATVGCFTNTLPLRLIFEPRLRFAQLVQRVSQSMLEALAHQELPFDQIIDSLGAERAGSSNPIFQAMFVMQSTPLDSEKRLGDAQVEEVVIHSGTSKVDVTCAIRATSRGFEGELEYSTDVLGQPEARGLVQSFLSLLAAATASPSTAVAELAMLSSLERRDLIIAANSSYATYPDFRPMHAHFEAQALARPEAIALEGGNGVVRYGELNDTASRFAGLLASAGVGPESLVGICMDRSVWMVTATLAVLKAGAGFVPLDPDFPVSRLQAITGDARLRLVITETRYAERLQSLQCSLLCADGVPLDEAGPALPVPVCAENVAYVYYTSGSTGVPKGVVLDQGCAMARLEWFHRQYPLAVGDRVLHKTPLIFDPAILEIFGALMAGATVLLADARAESDIEHVSLLLSSPRTVLTFFVPSMLEAYLEHAPPRAYPDLRWLPLVGEAVSKRLLERFTQHFGLELHSIYGNSETSDLALWRGSRWEGGAKVPIGRQMGIYRLYVLDAALNPVPPYVPGEICVAGIGGLARGYQGLPAVTAEKFVPNPYAIVSGERLYRTGDLARMLDDGTMEYLERADHQVKVRGCRIEIGEVEAVLLSHASVRACAVIVRNDASGVPQLLAYVVNEGLTVTELATHAEQALPRFMLPSAYIFLNELPRTPSGKLDRLRLPAARAVDFQARAVHEPPQTSLEAQLAALWKEILGLQSVGRSDNFFSLGGNSLKSMQVIARVQDEFQVTVRVRDFFTAPTIQGFALVLERALIDYVASLSDAEVEQHLGRTGAAAG